MRNIVLFVLLLFVHFYSIGQVNLYVSPNGKDANAGTVQNPYKTIGKAISIAEQYKGKVSVQLRRGTYYLANTLILNAANVSCTALNITGYKNEKVTISAGQKLNLQWMIYKNGIYQAIVPKGIVFEELYINGKPQPLARYPNYNDTARVYHGTSPDAIAPERVKRWKNPAGGYVHALHEGEWGSWDYLITGASKDGVLDLEGGWQNNRPSSMNKKYRFVENIFEELDAPGEWYLDKHKGLLYYYPVSPAKLSTAIVEVSHLKNSIELHGSGMRPICKITISKINFRHNERSFMDTREPLLRGDWCIYRGGAVLFDGTENCSIADCSFEGIGGNAIMVSNYNKKDTITGCLVADIGASAVCFAGDVKAVRSPLLKYEASQTYGEIDKTGGPLTPNYPQQCVVTNNLFHDLGQIEKQATGVQISMSSAITVSNNSIYNVPRAGLNINDGCWGGHIVAFNDVFNTVLETGDHGSFNSWGRDRYWDANRQYMDSLVAAHPELILLDATKRIEIHDNRFRCDHGWDIDLDDGSTNYHIYNNVCLNGGIKLREGFYRVVENNILINNSLHPHVWFKNSGDVFEHNIVMEKYMPYAITDWGKHIDSNFFTDKAALTEVRKAGTDAYSMAGNPMFVNAATGNYTIQPNSPAFGVNFKNIPMDEFGVQKPALKKLAQKPHFPKLIAVSQYQNHTKNNFFLGGEIRSVEGLGERSALGLPDASGVIIVSVSKNSLLARSGLRNNDVIAGIDNKQVLDADDLLSRYQTLKEKNTVTITIYRNQCPQTITLKIK